MKVRNRAESSEAKARRVRHAKFPPRVADGCVSLVTLHSRSGVVPS